MPKSLSLEDKAHEIKSPFHCEKEVQKSTVVQITKKEIFLYQSALDQFTKCVIFLVLVETRGFSKSNSKLKHTIQITLSMMYLQILLSVSDTWLLS